MFESLDNLLVSNGSFKKIRAAIQGLDLDNCVDFRGDSVLHHAVLARRFEVVDYILKKHNLLVKKKNSYGHKPLQLLLMQVP